LFQFAADPGPVGWVEHGKRSKAIYTGLPFDILPVWPVTRLIKIADWNGGVRVNVVLVHGLGGHAFDTWRHNGDDNTFWPAWLARDIPGLAAWTLAYDAPPSNWLGTGMALQDRAKNVLECLLGQSELRGRPLVFVGHSLGGLVVKQVLRTAEGRRAYSAAEAAFVDSVKGIVFIATPHTGSLHATLLDRLRLIAWPSASTIDLVKNNAGLRDLNLWYRNWSGGVRHKVFYEKRGTTAGVIVSDDSSDPGLLRVDPVPIDANHVDICKPEDESDLVYARTRDFIVDEIVPSQAWGISRRFDHPPLRGDLRQFALPPLRRSRPHNFAPIAVRVSVLLIVGLIAFKGMQALLFPLDLLSAATGIKEERPPVLQVRAKSPFHTRDPLDVRIQVLRPSFLFCFLLDQDGKEATLLYPTYETQRERKDLFGPSDGEMKFPDGFKSLKDTITIQLDKPAIEFFHCIATEQPLRDRLEALWFENTAAQRKLVSDRLSPSVTPDMTREILSGLRASEGYAEASARIEIVSK
jgi:pimeloyl-ACP methyl ester carboxylesterase